MSDDFHTRRAFVTLGDPLDLPPPLPTSAPLSDRYAQMLSALLAQAEAAENGLYRPLPTSYIIAAHHYLAHNHAAARRSRARRAGVPFPKTSSLQPVDQRLEAPPIPDHIAEQAQRALLDWVASAGAVEELPGACSTAPAPTLGLDLVLKPIADD